MSGALGRTRATHVLLGEPYNTRYNTIRWDSPTTITFLIFNWLTKSGHQRKIGKSQTDVARFIVRCGWLCARQNGNRFTEVNSRIKNPSFVEFQLGFLVTSATQRMKCDSNLREDLASAIHTYSNLYWWLNRICAMVVYIRPPAGAAVSLEDYFGA